jgi:hypothetical protein
MQVRPISADARATRRTNNRPDARRDERERFALSESPSGTTVDVDHLIARVAVREVNMGYAECDSRQ